MVQVTANILNRTCFKCGAGAGVRDINLYIDYERVSIACHSCGAAVSCYDGKDAAIDKWNNMTVEQYEYERGEPYDAEKLKLLTAFYLNCGLTDPELEKIRCYLIDDSKKLIKNPK